VIRNKKDKNMKHRKIVTFALLICLVACNGLRAQQKAPKKFPNVLMIVADDMNWDSPGCFGGAAPWKVVGRGNPQNPKDLKDWKLFDIEADRTEVNDLAEAYPERLGQMVQAWHDWAKRTNGR
jgi:hypothetical protein